MKELEDRANKIVSLNEEAFREEMIERQKEQDSYLILQKTKMGSKLPKDEFPFWTKEAKNNTKRFFLEYDKKTPFTRSQLKEFYTAVN